MANSRKKDLQQESKVFTGSGRIIRYGRFQSQLSGGKQQIAVIARALANESPILLANEHTGEFRTENIHYKHHK